MKMKKIYILSLLLTLSLVSCRDPFEIQSIDFQNSLVVEATLTNEFKQHTLKLSRTYELNQEVGAFEDGAAVSVEDSEGNIFLFNPIGQGVYESELEFQAIPNVNYTLNITTTEGERFQSSTKSLTPISEITDLYGELITNASGEEGIQLFIDSDNQNSEALYFRYEYEETYQVIPPFYSELKVELTNYVEEIVYNPRPDIQVTYDIELIPRSQEEQVCYSSDQQKGIILTTTNSLSNNGVERLPIRFISKEDRILRDRYSILVKQYVQSIESYSYYKTLDDLGNTESILSQSQPGFVFGNISSLENPDQKVVGYFDVSSVSQKRIFFNYLDFNLPQPDYLFSCEIIELDYNDNSTADLDKNDRIEIYRLLTLFEEQNQSYEIYELPQLFPSGIWQVVRPECGDCTSVASNIRPDFWED